MLVFNDNKKGSGMLPFFLFENIKPAFQAKGGFAIFIKLSGTKFSFLFSQVLFLLLLPVPHRRDVSKDELCPYRSKL